MRFILRQLTRPKQEEVRIPWLWQRSILLQPFGLVLAPAVFEGAEGFGADVEVDGGGADEEDEEDGEPGGEGGGLGLEAGEEEEEEAAEEGGGEFEGAGAEEAGFLGEEEGASEAAAGGVDHADEDHGEEAEVVVVGDGHADDG